MSVTDGWYLFLSHQTKLFVRNWEDAGYGCFFGTPFSSGMTRAAGYVYAHASPEATSSVRCKWIFREKNRVPVNGDKVVESLRNRFGSLVDGLLGG